MGRGAVNGEVVESRSCVLLLLRNISISISISSEMAPGMRMMAFAAEMTQTATIATSPPTQPNPPCTITAAWLWRAAMAPLPPAERRMRALYTTGSVEHLRLHS